MLSIEFAQNQAGTNSIFSIGAVAVSENMILVDDCFEANLNKELSNIESDNAGHEVAKPNNILFEQNAIVNLLSFVGSSTLVGYRIDAELEPVNIILKNMNCGSLKNQALDIEVMFRKWKNISEDKQIEINSMFHVFELKPSERNTTIDHAFDLGIAFLKLKKRLQF